MPKKPTYEELEQRVLELEEADFKRKNAEDSLQQAEEHILRHVEELRTLNSDLSRFNKSAVGRELRMIELKKEINELCARAGQPRRYDLDFTGEQP